jgi:hypothetical protein
MSTVRIQVRRGTASQWESVDPTLVAGEMGLETDTNKIKVGTGNAAWTALPYLNVVPADLTNTLSDYVEVGDVGNAGGPAKLDADGNLLIPKSSIILEGSSTDAYETILTVTNPTADRTITFPDATGTVALTSDIAELSQDAIDSALTAGTGIIKNYNDESNTLTLSIDTGVIATTEALRSVVSSLNIHEAVDVATTEPLAATYTAGTSDLHGGTGIGAKLTMNANGVLIIDNWTLRQYDRVLVKNQPNVLHNGIYELTTLGTSSVAAVLTRSVDYDNSLDQSPGAVAQGDVVFVNHGNTNQLKQFSQINEGSNTDKTVKIGIDSIEFTQISGTATLKEGTGINIVEDTISVDDSVFLSVSAASSTYLTQGTASSNYLTQTNAASTYLTQTNAASTYLTPGTAASTYLTQTDAGTTYLTQTDAGTTYFAKNTTAISNSNIAANAAIDKNKISGVAVTQGDTATVTNTMLAGSISNDKLAGSIANNKLANSTISGKSLGSNLDALTIGTGLSGSSYNGSSAVTIAVDSTIATKTYADTAVSEHSSDTTSVHGIADTSALATKTYADTAVSNHEADTTSVHGISDTSQIAFLNAETQQFTGDMGITGDLVVDGDVTVNGGSFSASATSIVIEDNLVQIAHQNAANTVDLGLVVGYNDGTAKHAGIVRDVSANEWKLFKGVTTEPSTTVDFTQGSLDDLELNNLTAAGIIFTDGTQTKEGVPSRTPIISKTANYTLTNLSERDSLIEVDSTSPVTITIPTNSAVAFPVGTTLDILGVNTGLITIAGDTGVTVNATPGLKLRTQWSSCTLFKRGENAWVVYGDLKS